MSETKKYVLSEVVAEAAEKHPDIEIALSDGPVFIPPPQRWSDDLIAVGLVDPIQTARKLLGEKYQQFSDEGGSAMLLLDIIKDQSGVSLGESSTS